VTYEPVLDGPDGRPNSGPDAAASTWPVLARLPWVGESEIREEPRARYVEPAAEPAGRREAHPTPSLRIADTPAESSRKFIDRAHAPAPTAPAAPSKSHYEAIAGSVAAEPMPREAASRQRRHRIDLGDARHIDALAATMRSHVLPINEPTTFAARVFQWHASATPHAGVVLTFVLAFSAGLLYWFTMGRPQATTVNDGANGAPIWTSESIDPTKVARESLNGPGRSQEVEEFSWSKRKAAKPLSSEAAKLEVPPLGDEFVVEKPETTGAIPIAPSNSEPAPAPVSNTPVAAASTTPTPAVTTNSPYPTTPYAPIDFGLVPETTLSPSVAAPGAQGTVAERPAGGASQPSTR